jgi:hypothetical protein
MSLSEREAGALFCLPLPGVPGAGRRAIPICSSGSACLRCGRPQHNLPGDNWKRQGKEKYHDYLLWRLIEKNGERVACFFASNRL